MASLTLHSTTPEPVHPFPCVGSACQTADHLFDAVEFASGLGAVEGPGSQPQSFPRQSGHAEEIYFRYLRNICRDST